MIRLLVILLISVSYQGLGQVSHSLKKEFHAMGTAFEVTAVAKDSPASVVLEKGDVIVGAFAKPFDSDARTAFGKAITAAEAETGELPLLRWRDGKTEEVTIKLPALGNYSKTAPYDCPKSKAVFERGCEALAEQMRSSTKRGNAIVRSMPLRTMRIFLKPARSAMVIIFSP